MNPPATSTSTDQFVAHALGRLRAKRSIRDRARSGPPRDIQRVEFLEDLHPATGERYYVYFIRGAGLVKIGTSRDPRGRIADISGASPVPIEFMFAWRVNCLQGIKGNLELAAHRHFKDCRRHGEWFALTDAQIQACRSSLWWVVGGGEPAWTRRFKKHHPSTTHQTPG